MVDRLALGRACRLSGQNLCHSIQCRSRYFGFYLICVLAMCAGCGSRAAPSIRYHFHYNLSEDEMGELPDDVARLAGLIQAQSVDAMDLVERDAIFARCPHREKTSRGTLRLFWNLEGKRAEEGEKCIFFFLDNQGQIRQCGLGIVG